MKIALLLGLVTFLIYVIEYAGGRNFISQPIMVGMVTGIVLGDVKAGVMIGGTLELAFLGATSIGAVIPPDAMTGTILGTAFAIKSGASAESALVLALPISSLALILKNFYYGYVVSLFERKADKYAAEGSTAGIERVHWMTGFGMALMLSLVVTISYAVGSDAVSSFLNSIPSFITTGMNIAIGLIPAIGFSLLAKTMLTKANWYYFLCGFAMVAYLNMPILGVAIFGLILAMIVCQTAARNSAAEVNKEGDEEDDF